MSPLPAAFHGASVSGEPRFDVGALLVFYVPAFECGAGKRGAGALVAMVYGCRQMRVISRQAGGLNERAHERQSFVLTSDVLGLDALTYGYQASGVSSSFRECIRQCGAQV